MPSEPSSLPPDGAIPALRRRGRPPWIIALGGILLSLGTVITGATHWDVFVLGGGLQTGMRVDLYLNLVQFEMTLTAIGNVLVGAGFLAIIIGVAWAARAPRVPDRSPSGRRIFAVAVLGGLLVLAGLVLLSAIGFYAYAPSPSPWGTLNQLALDLAGRIVEAIGFFVAFVGIALGFRARP